MIPTQIASPAGPLSLRPATQQDDDFRFCLFRSARKLEAQLSHLDAHLVAIIMQGQYRAQAAAIQARHKLALILVVELPTAPIGVIILAQEGAATHVMDVALLPPWRGQGIGTALLRAVMAAADAACHTVQLSVATDNTDAHRLYAHLGFHLTSSDDAYHHLQWPPAPLPTAP